jgi:hypothetical protein
MNIENLIQKAENLGLINITTEIQKKHDTIMFLEPKSNDKYGVYLKSGYARRFYKVDYPWAPSSFYWYQLNSVKSLPGYPNLKTRILFPNDPEKLFSFIFKRFE